MQIEEVLRDRDTAAQDIALSSSPGANGDLGLSDMPPSQTLPPQPRRGNAPPKLDRKQVEQRIEEDRERHKRLRENIWAVPSGDHAELDKLWEETSDLGEDDERMHEEEWQEWKMVQQQNSCGHPREAAAQEKATNGKHAN